MSRPRPTLRRVVTLPWLVLYGLGTTIGAGIYALTGVVAGRAGMQAPAAFLLAALLASFTAFSFAELSSRFPRAGGEAVYVREGFGLAWLSSAVGILIVLAGVVSAATVSVRPSSRSHAPPASASWSSPSVPSLPGACASP
jgi:amino acid transporter